MSGQMYLGALHFDGDPGALLPAYHRLLERFGLGALDVHLCISRDDGLTVFDACPAKAVTAAGWLVAIEEIQRFSRMVARFFTGYDAFLTPTMSAPPLPIGSMVSTPEDPWRSLEVSAQTVHYAGVVANLTGSPAMSVPLWWERRRPADRRARPGPVRRRGHAHPVGIAARSGPAVGLRQQAVHAAGPPVIR